MLLTVNAPNVVNVTGIWVQAPVLNGNFVTGSVTGIYIENQVSDGNAGNETWALKIDDQTPESGNHYSIITGAGPVSFGDSLQVHNNTDSSGFTVTFRGDADPGSIFPFEYQLPK